MPTRTSDDPWVIAFRVNFGGDNDCWLWTGSHANFNPKCPTVHYGRCTIDYNQDYAHRVSYLLTNGPIPKGMTVDHTCWNTLCWNPAHLELKTPGANSANKSPAWREKQLAMRRAFKDCGHPRERNPDGRLKHCRECNLLAKAKYRKRQSAKRLVGI